MDVSCPKCHSTDCIQISIDLTGADLVEFYSCRDCETKWWVRDGDHIQLDAVLTMAASQRRSR